MTLVDQKMKKASSDMEAAFERIPPPVLPENPRTSPDGSKDARAAVLAIGIFAVVAISLSFLAPGGTPALEEESTPSTLSEPSPPEGTLTWTIVETTRFFQPILAGDEILGLGSGVWIPDGEEGWRMVDYTIVGETREGSIVELGAIGGGYAAIYRTNGNDGTDPSDILVYSDDAMTWHPADVVDDRAQPRWKLASGNGRVLALAQPDPTDETWESMESMLAYAYTWEVWVSDDGRTWNLATTLNLDRFNPWDVVHRDGQFYLTGSSDMRDDGTTPGPMVWTSPDGVAWQRVALPQDARTNSPTQVETINNTLVVATAFEVWALTGGTWTNVTPSGYVGASLIEQADRSGPLFLIDGGQSPLRSDPWGAMPYRTPTVWWTFDGYNWSSKTFDEWADMEGIFGTGATGVAVGKTVVAEHTFGNTSIGYWIGTLD